MGKYEYGPVVEQASPGLLAESERLVGRLSSVLNRLDSIKGTLLGPSADTEAANASPTGNSNVAWILSMAHDYLSRSESVLSSIEFRL